MSPQGEAGRGDDGLLVALASRPPAWLPTFELLQWPLLERLRTGRAELLRSFEANPTADTRHAVNAHVRVAFETLAGDWGTVSAPLAHGRESVELLRQDLATLDEMCEALSKLTGGP
jgi:hypothetical protein